MEESTLLIRHLPKELSHDERKDFLHHIGATQVCLNGTSGPMRHTAFAVFPNKEIASKILEQLHQAEFLGSSLVVEFARRSKATIPSVVDNEGVSTSDKLTKEDKEKSAEASQLKVQKEVKFDTTFATWGVKHPRRPELKYLYPPPSPSILTNIMHTLASQPRFYTQVLHLMNKMDLPAPFGIMTSMPPMTRGVPMTSVTPAPMTSAHDPDDMDHREMDISSTEESEMDDSGGEGRPAVKREARQTIKRKKRPHKRPRLADLQDAPAPLPSAPSLPVSQVFEQTQEGTTQSRRIQLRIGGESLQQTNTLPPREALYDPSVPSLPQSLPHSNLPLSLTHSSLPPQHSNLPPRLPPPSSNWNHPAESGDPYASSGMLGDGSQEQYRDEDLYRGKHQHAPDNTSDLYTCTLPKDQDTTAGGFGILQPKPKEDNNEEETESAEQSWSKAKFISKSELRKSRLSTEEMRSTSVFKRYNPGEPSCRLYIKNLSKQVTEEDLHWMFGRYVNWEDTTETNIFDIRLMKEGRMKGQAFVTLPTEESAKSAVRDTNAFVLKDKPMVVQFARSAKAEEDKASQI